MKHWTPPKPEKPPAVIAYVEHGAIVFWAEEGNRGEYWQAHRGSPAAIEAWQSYQGWLRRQ